VLLHGKVTTSRVRRPRNIIKRTEGQGKTEGRKEMRTMKNSVTLKFRGGM
jgi:hypothetical protein